MEAFAAGWEMVSVGAVKAHRTLRLACPLRPWLSVATKVNGLSPLTKVMLTGNEPVCSGMDWPLRVRLAKVDGVVKFEPYARARATGKKISVYPAGE